MKDSCESSNDQAMVIVLFWKQLNGKIYLIKSQELLEGEGTLVTEDFLLRARQRDSAAWSSIYKEFSLRLYRYIFLK
ncbi:MAG: hypothetical protein Q8Q15_03135, partial [bacterium]|nr:hypothetical protein [bacterium]